MPDIILVQEETDALAEICNITFGAAANKLSDILHAQSKIAKPQINVSSAEELSQAYAEKSIVLKFGYSNAYQGVWLFFVDADSADKLISALGGKDDPALINNLMSDLLKIVGNTILSTMNRQIDFDQGQCGLNDSSQVKSDAAQDFKDGLYRIKFVFKAQDIFDGSLISFISASFAKALASDFLNAISAQMQDFSQSSADMPSAKKSAGSERLEKIMAFCSQIGDFRLVEGLKAPVIVRMVEKKMLYKQLWELTAGSVLNFTRRIDEPNSIYYSNKPIAKGEVVSVKDKFGIKITEVLK